MWPFLKLMWYNLIGVFMDEKENKKIDEKDDKEKENLENKTYEIDLNSNTDDMSDLLEELTKNLPKEEQKKMRKLVKTFNLKRDKGFKLVLNKVLRILSSTIFYGLIYFLLFGLFFNYINVTKKINVFYFISSLSLYQGLCREYIKVFSKNKKCYIYIAFLFISLFITSSYLKITNFVTFNSVGLFTLYYLLGETIKLIFDYYIMKHKILNIFR